MSAPRADLGYDAAGAPQSSGRVCKCCQKPAALLHHDPRSNSPERTICGACQGELNARRMRRERPRDGGA